MGAGTDRAVPLRRAWFPPWPGGRHREHGCLPGRLQTHRMPASSVAPYFPV